MLEINSSIRFTEKFSKVIKAGMFVLIAGSGILMSASPTIAIAQTQQGTEQTPIEVMPDNRVNINSADAETLALALDGVGMSKARDIIAYREENGEFKTVDDLQKVRGIGKATLERNRSRILLDDSTE